MPACRLITSKSEERDAFLDSMLGIDEPEVWENVEIYVNDNISHCQMQ